MDFSYVAARKLQHGRIPLVGLIGTDKHSDAGCFSFRERILDISDLVAGYLSGKWPSVTSTVILPNFDWIRILR
jgi:hypothetical protein